MNTATWLLLVLLVAVVAWTIGFEHCWWQFVAPLREELLDARFPKLTEADLAALPDEPKPETTYDVATVDRKTLRIVGAQRVVIHHNAQPEARN